MSSFEYTSFEPGRHQRSEVATLQTHFSAALRTHPVSWNRIGWNVRLRQGPLTQANLGREPSRGQHRTTSYNCWQLHSLPGHLHEHTPFRTQGLSCLIDHKGSVSYKLIRFFSIMGKSKANKRKTDFSGEDLNSPTRAKRYELKLFSILPLDSIRVGLSIPFGIAEILEIWLLVLLVALFLRI